MNEGNKISLDKSIKVSRQILNGERPCNHDILIESSSNGVGKFEFKPSPRHNVIDSEHIGLAQLAYEFASNSFHTLVKGEDGTTQRVFDPLPQGAHISDFLKDCNPDTLTWYQNKYGEPLKFGFDENGEVARVDVSSLEKSYSAAIDENSHLSQRTEAVAEALFCATWEYVKALEDNCDLTSEQLDQVVSEEITNNVQNLYTLREQALHTNFNQNCGNYINTTQDSNQ